MSSLGIYFGTNLIGLIETKKEQILNYVNIPLSRISGLQTEQKVPEEIKIVAVLKEELRKMKAEAKEVFAGLSGKDLVLRTFELPFLPPEELGNAVRFEVKKYLPFRIEELIFDFSLRLDKKAKRYSVLFMGIKKEKVDFYLSVLKQIQIPIKSLEYTGISATRLLRLGHCKGRGIIGLVSGSLQEEINFLVLKDGFVLFSRDITLSSRYEDEAARVSTEVLVEKLKSEIRISLDYYKRKFPSKSLESVLFFIDSEARPEMQNLLKELGVPCRFPEISKLAGKRVPLGADLYKAYSLALAKTTKSFTDIDLLDIISRARQPKKEVVSLHTKDILRNLKISPLIIIISGLIIILSLALGYQKRVPLQKELADLKALQLSLKDIPTDTSYEELRNIESGYADKIKVIKKEARRRFALGSILDAISEVLPEGSWLSRISFKGERSATVILEGMVYLDDRNKEFMAVNDIIIALKKRPELRHFKEIGLDSLRQQKLASLEIKVSKFIIRCTGWTE
jgi:hypothetical protein